MPCAAGCGKWMLRLAVASCRPSPACMLATPCLPDFSNLPAVFTDRLWQRGSRPGRVTMAIFGDTTPLFVHAPSPVLLVCPACQGRVPLVAKSYPMTLSRQHWYDE